MSNINSIGFALDPTNVPSFLLDWELTKLCNLDCSYCASGIDGCHDNTTSHPPLDECLRTIDFMYKYVDEYTKYKKPSQRKVVLNVYGGESLFHPNIVEILEACKEKYQQYKDNWYLTITCTTNGIVGKNQWARIVPLVDVFTVSYHSENLPKQKQQYQDNVLYLKEQSKRFKCVIMMHNNIEYFEDGQSMIEFCQTHNIQYVAKPLDNTGPEWTYTEPQFQVLKNFWVSQSSTLNRVDYKKTIDAVGNTDQVHSINEGRPCCGGRKLSLNGDLKSFVTFVPKQGFEGWSCSVNWFFLFVQQLTGNVYTNKDCRMSTSGIVEPLGNLKDSDQIINTLHKQLETGTMPIIQCKKQICLCGICAPKAETKEDFMQLITRNVSVDVFQKEC
jgi:pyruvate-formate lyase-activating enzyme